MQFDLLVIGMTPAGWQAALAAAKLQLRVGIIEEPPATTRLPGFASGSVSLEMLNKAIWNLPEVVTAESPRHIDLSRLRNQLGELLLRERTLLRTQLRRNEITVVRGNARFVGPHQVEVGQGTGAGQLIKAERVLIATGCYTVRPAGITCNTACDYSFQELFARNALPKSLHIIGGGITGLRSGLLFADLGVPVTIVDGRSNLLEQPVSSRISDLHLQSQKAGIQFKLGEDVIAVETHPRQKTGLVLVSGRRFTGDALLMAAGKMGRTSQLDLPKAGLTADERGRLWCSPQGQTWVKHIYAAGDVVGFPPEAADDPQTAQTIVQHAFGESRTRVESPILPARHCEPAFN